MDERDRFGANMQGLYVKIKGAFSSRCCFEESPFNSFRFCKLGVLFTTAECWYLGALGDLVLCDLRLAT